jgi:hypothetical protein
MQHQQQVLAQQLHLSLLLLLELGRDLQQQHQSWSKQRGC